MGTGGEPAADEGLPYLPHTCRPPLFTVRTQTRGQTDVHPYLYTSILTSRHTLIIHRHKALANPGGVWDETLRCPICYIPRYGKLLICVGTAFLLSHSN